MPRLHCSPRSGVGRKGLYVYNLPEVQSAYKIFGVKSASARFGTDPFFWNWAMWLVARLVPRGLLANRGFVQGLARLAEPMVRATDAVTGEKVVSGLEDAGIGVRPVSTLVHLFNPVGRVSAVNG